MMAKAAARMVGRTPWSAADALVGLLRMRESDFVGEERVQGDPRGPGGPPHHVYRILSSAKSKWYWAGEAHR